MKMLDSAKAVCAEAREPNHWYLAQEGKVGGAQASLSTVKTEAQQHLGN